MRKVVFAITYILFQVLYNQLTKFSLIVNRTRYQTLCTLYFIFSYIPNVLLIITEIIAYISQFPIRIDALIVDIYMNVTKESWVMSIDIRANYLILKAEIDANYETKSLDIKMILNYY